MDQSRRRGDAGESRTYQYYWQYWQCLCSYQGVVTATEDTEAIRTTGRDVLEGPTTNRLDN